MTLTEFRRPDAFLDDFVDESELAPANLGCLLHCMRDVLRGHGVTPTVRYIVRPLQVVFSMDPRMRPWIYSGAEEELTRPAFEYGLRTAYRWTDDTAGLVKAIDDSLTAGHAAIVFANRWLVPWQPQSPLAQSEGHASVVLGRDGDRLHLVDRAMAENTTRSRDVQVQVADLEPSLRHGMAVLDYELAEPPMDPPEQARSLVRRSARNLACAPPEPQLRAHGLDAVDTLRLLFSDEAFRRIDSPHLRLSMRWHLGSCIHKYVVGSRLLLRAYVQLDAPDARLVEALDRSVERWRHLARAFSLAARPRSTGTADLVTAIDATRVAEVMLIEALTAAG